MTTPIYIGTILLERNRWSPGKVPTYRVSEWLDRFARDGFDGVELWENHVALCSDDELARLEHAALPIVVFNSYAGMGDGGLPERDQAARVANRLGACAIKFNVGNVPDNSAEYARNAQVWADDMPRVARMLCECHPGTIMEELSVAQATYASWHDNRFQAIVHAFSEPEEMLIEKLHRLGTHIVTHVHTALGAHTAETKELVHRRVDILRDMGFTGSFTLEFTEGTGEPDEDMETMYGRALRDLELLRKELNARK
ncbi:MAG: sugar phosphate isomerase/epimerase family protein [Armatimonadota bacterium]